MLVETADMLRVGAVNVLIMTFKKKLTLLLGHVFFSLMCFVFAKIMELFVTHVMEKKIPLPWHL